MSFDYWKHKIYYLKNEGESESVIIQVNNQRRLGIEKKGKKLISILQTLNFAEGGSKWQ